MYTPRNEVEIYSREKHLEFILSAINRTNNLLMVCKGSAFLVAAAFMIMKLHDEETLILSSILLIFLWYKDSSYTALSKCFYELYEDVRKNDYSTDPYTMSIDKFKHQIKSVRRTMLSPTKAFYPVMILLTQFLVDAVTPRMIIP
ncbi:MAG: hypothetical protein PHQ11_15535 [Paludibacter sp.]|jgi:hypothetical protein|nr:hypothetical protein [Paludibacter sp.]